MSETNEMSGTQRLFTRFVPKSWAASMEAESRQWMVKCPNCGFERSVWELGGIRWKAAGNARQRLRCPTCGQMGWHVVYKKQETI